MLPVTLQKIEEAFAFGATDEEACFYADISPRALYYFQERNPEYVQRKALLKERPILLARQTVIKGMQEDPNLALKYLERKRKKEFAPRTEQTGADGAELMGVVMYKPDKLAANFDSSK